MGDGLMKQLKLKRQFRSMPSDFVVERAADGEKDQCVRVQATLTSEYPVQRFFGMEILGHAKGEVDLTRIVGGPVLYADAAAGDHRGRRVGVVEKARVDTENKCLRITMKMSRNEDVQKVIRDIEDGILGQMSGGYMPEKMQRESTDATKGDTMRVVRWCPLEATIVNGVPADPTVGVGRADDGDDEYAVEVEGDEPAKEERKMKKRVLDEASGVVIEVDESDPRPAHVERATAITVQQPNKETMLRDVIAVATQYGCAERIGDFVSKDMDANAVRKLLLDESRSDVLPTPGAEVMDKKDRSKYRLSRAILCAADQKFDGIEGEVHKELYSRITGYDYKGGILIPMDQGDPRLSGRAALDSKTAGGGAEYVYDQPGSLIEILRNRSVFIGLGAQVLTGLSGPVPFPKQTGATTAYWVGENPSTDVPESEPTFGQAVLTPRSLMATTAYSRQLLAQQSLDTDALVKSDLGAVHTLALDRAGWHGKGAAGEPTGIYMAADVLSIDPDAVITYPLLVSMLGKIAEANADGVELKFATTPGMAQMLMTALKMTNVGTSFVWEGNFREGVIGGYRAVATANISKTMATNEPTGGTYHGLVAGNFNDALVGMWQAMELITDIYSQKKKALIEVTSFQMTDILVRRGVSFCKATRAKIA
jgi:HK97 family phage major capsid protein